MGHQTKLTMLEELGEVFKNINDWLKFAEAKNGVLVALNGAAMWGVIQNIQSIYCYSPYLGGYVVVFAISAFIGLIFSLWSFLPSVHMHQKIESELKDVDPSSLSLYFFRDVRRFTYKDYLERFYKAKKIREPDSYPTLELDLSNQIVQNARTTWFKYKMFFLALIITLSGMIIPIPFLVARFFYMKKINKGKAE